MNGRIPENILEDILSRTDIVNLISGYIPLKRAGRNFKALCPFHHEKTPSFMVSPEKQIYHCFGCHESGNAFKFLMAYERLEFPEAAELLAKKAGVVLPKPHEEDYKTTSLTTQLYKINELAAAFYENNLHLQQAQAHAKNYLLKRGIKDETIKAFKLGYAPDKWDALISHLREKSVSLSLLEKAGLILAKESGGYYDRFRHRIIFPIVDIKARPLGFGARVLDDNLPKYINSPETPIYTKGRNLFGLHLAKDSIREFDFAIIVEGYLDFIMPFQAGLKNMIASLGTALTIEQARLLKRYTHNVVMVYDGDAAGEIAALRNLDVFIEEEMNVKVVSLPQGFDPDSFVRKFGISALKEKIKGAQNIFDYKLKVLKTRYNIKEIEEKAKIAAEILPTIKKIKNAILKAEYIKKLAEELKVAEQFILEELKRIKLDMPYQGLERVAPKKELKINPTEKLLVKLMLEETALINQMRESLEPADFQDARLARIVSIMFDLVAQGKHIEPSHLMNYLDEEGITQVIGEAMFLPEDLSGQDKEKLIQDCIKRLKHERIKLKRHHLHEQIKTAQDTGDEETLERLMQEFHYLIKKG
jgi:DNA primase